MKKREEEQGEKPPASHVHLAHNVRPWITAVDVALENIGLAQSYQDDYEGADVQIREVLSSVHSTPDGRLFEYEEAQIPRLCWEWVVAFRHYWQGSKIIFLEKQLSKRNIQKERACLLIQTTLEGIFLCLYQLGLGPKPVCNVAKWWRDAHNLPTTNDHDQNKKNSVDKYESIYGRQKLTEMRMKWDKVDDVAEATLMLLVVNKNYDELIDSRFPSKHVETPNETRIKAEDRLKELPKLPAHTLGELKPHFSPVHLRRSYKEFVSRRKAGRKLRENEKVYKKYHPNSKTTSSKKRKQDTTTSQLVVEKL